MLHGSLQKVDRTSEMKNGSLVLNLNLCVCVCVQYVHAWVYSCVCQRASVSMVSIHFLG